MFDLSTLVPGVNGSIKGRGLNQRGLTEAQRIALATAARMGTLSVGNLSAQQASTLFSVPVTVVDEEIKRRREAQLSDETAYLVSVWKGTSPAGREAALTALGVIVSFHPL